jgi:hypothetical protein
MRTRFSTAAAAASASVAALLAAAAGPAAAAGGFAAEYAVYLGGLPALEATFTVAGPAGDAYGVEAAARTRGLLASLAPWENRTRSEGRVAADGRLVPRAHEVVSTWRGEPRSVALGYDAAGAVVSSRAVPAAEADAREPVPDHLKPGTADVLTGVLGLLDAMDDGAGCDRTVPVYDGRRRYDIAVRSAGVRLLAPNRYSLFSGEATVCELRFRTLAGRPVGRERSRFWRSEDGEGNQGWPATAYVAPAGPGGRMVPVRLELETPLGFAVAHLTGVRPAEER